jgi:hypothetical protein
MANSLTAIAELVPSALVGLKQNVPETQDNSGAIFSKALMDLFNQYPGHRPVDDSYRVYWKTIRPLLKTITLKQIIKGISQSVYFSPRYPLNSGLLAQIILGNFTDHEVLEAFKKSPQGTADRIEDMSIGNNRKRARQEQEAKIRERALPEISPVEPDSWVAKTDQLRQALIRGEITKEQKDMLWNKLFDEMIGSHTCEVGQNGV